MYVCCVISSAGIGRSGVFIGADIGMKKLEEKGEVDVLNIVSSIRQDRGGMVQTREQYLFLHKVRMSTVLNIHIDVYVVLLLFF